MSNALTKIQAKEKPKWLSLAHLDQLKERGAHILVPAQYQAQVSPYWQGVYEIVFLSPNPDDKDVWKLPGGGGKLGLSKTGLMKIARAAGIELYQSKVEERGPGYIRYWAQVRKRNASGAWEYAHSTKSFDRSILLEDAIATAKAKMGEEAAKKKGEEDTRRFWKFHEERCETGAYLRAIRSMLSIRGDYSAQDLTKPFVVQTVHFSPDQSQPELREMMANAAKLTAVQLWSNSPEERAALEQRTGMSIAQLEEQRAHVHQLREGSGDDEAPADDELDRMMHAVNGATPITEPLDEEEDLA